MKNNLIKISYIFIIILMIVFGLNVYAVTETELQNKKQEVDDKILQTNTEIAGIKDEMSTTLAQITRLNVQIKDYEDNIEQAGIQLEEVTKELEVKKLELKEANEKYNKQKSIFEARLVAMYESSKTTYLDILFGSNDLSDFLSKYYLLQKIAECDNDLLKSLDISEKVIEMETEQLKDKQNDVERARERLDSKYGAMEVLIRDKNNLVNTLSEEEKELERELNQFEEDKKQIEQELKELARLNAIKASVTPSNCGYISPLVRKN